MFAYCDNNPVNGYDPTGHSWKSFWSKVGSTIASAASSFVKAVSKVFSASASVVRQDTTITKETKYGYGLVTQTTGTRTEVTSASAGNTSSPHYIYAEGRSDNIFMSSIGAGYNIGNFSMNASIGLDELGTKLSYSRENSTTSLSLVGNISTLQLGVEYAVTTNNTPATAVTCFTNVSINLLPTAVFVVIAGLSSVGFPTIGYA